MLLLVAGAVLELAFYWLRPLWAGRRFWVPLLVALTAFGNAALFVWWPNVPSGLLLLLSLYRIFNDLRVSEQRMHEQFLRWSTRRTSTVLIALQAGIALVWYAWQHFELAAQPLWTVLTAVQLLVAVVLVSSVIRRLDRTEPHLGKQHYSDAQLPSITVAIPARNETDDLQACLDSVIASNYPKLEIIVLDDCSQLRRTPEIIRSFAHAGVRFVQGEPPADTWLPKNQAYRRLVGEASGEYVLFCGVDVRFAPDSIRKLVTSLLDRRKKMVSVLPERAEDGTSAMVQAMRYWWEMVPPRRLFQRPPVLSTCWLVDKQALRKIGGFEAGRRAIVPEAYLAKQFIRQDGYSFLRSGRVLGISSHKQPPEQRATALRTRYPQLHRRPESVCLTAVAEFTFLLLPFVLAVGGFWWEIGTAAQVLAALAAAGLTLAYLLLVVATGVSRWWLALVSFPIVVLMDLGLLHYSMYKYEFSEVIWKERNICIPAMHVIPHLPKL